MKVLISPGYGAGFSTWNDDPKIAIDEKLIEAFENGISKDAFASLCTELGYERVYLGGFKDLKVVEVPDDIYFKIREYDGYEHIEVLDLEDEGWIYSGPEEVE